MTSLDYYRAQSSLVDTFQNTKKNPYKLEQTKTEKCDLQNKQSALL